jgi:putative hydrolase of the HAD superfamily
MASGALTTVGFDADDTLWQNEQFFRITQARFADLLRGFAEPDHLAERLLEAERRNLGHYGFGVKGFILSMIETALEVTGDRVPGPVIGELLAAGREMLAHPIELLPHARDTVAEISESHRILLITKGDLLDQERKLAQSGLGEMFHGVEVVSQKTADVYARIFDRHGDGAARAMMVGNSMKSDVLPALAVGSWGVHVPHEMTWELEHEIAPVGQPRFHEMPDLASLPDLVRSLT